MRPRCSAILGSNILAGKNGRVRGSNEMEADEEGTLLRLNMEHCRTARIGTRSLRCGLRQSLGRLKLDGMRQHSHASFQMLHR
jgi:hypothetical protein